MLLTAKKAPGSSPPSPDRRESPRPGYFVVLVVFFFFSLRISMFLFPKETRICPLEPGTVTGCLARRLCRGRLFFPFWKGKRKEEKKKKENTKKGGETPPACAPSRGRGAGLALPPPSRAVQPHLTPMPLPGRGARPRTIAGKTGHGNETVLTGKPVLIMLSYQWTEDGLFEPLTNKRKLLLFIVRVSG